MPTGPSSRVSSRVISTRKVWYAIAPSLCLLGFSALDVERSRACPREPKRDQDQPLDILRFPISRTGNNRREQADRRGFRASVNFAAANGTANMFLFRFDSRPGWL